MAGMKLRIIFGALMILALAALLWWDHWLQETARPLIGAPTAALAAVLLMAAAMEYSRLAAEAQLPAMPLVTVVCAMGVGLAPFWASRIPTDRLSHAEWFLLAVPAAFALSFLSLMARRRVERGFVRLAATILGVVYVGGFGAFVLAVRMRFGVPALVVFLGAVKLTDIGAYFVGSAIGRHKLIPWLSPGKSWEGLAGGLALGALGAMGLNALCGTGLTVGWAALFGLILGLVGQFGDLCESFLKRSARQKDAAALVPEFGGVLDILDSPLVAAPVAYALLAVLG